MKTISKVRENLNYHIVDSIALFNVSTPTGAFLENVLAGMSDSTSAKSRLIVGALYLGGLGWAIGKGRDLSRKFFKITDATKERYQQIHDMAYIAGVTLFVNPPIYLAAGARTFKEIALATGFATLAGLAAGGIMGYSIDVERDLVGLETCERSSYPKSIRNKGSKFKRGLAIGLTAASIGLAGLIYSLTPNKDVEVQNPIAVEQTINKNSLEDFVQTQTESDAVIPESY